VRHPKQTWLCCHSKSRYVRLTTTNEAFGPPVLLDPFCGSGTMLLAGLDQAASKVIGVEKDAKYLKTTKKQIAVG
jgi:DNA modification methylase